jgi:hypothetical protein
MRPLIEALAPWQNFYTLCGTASATLVGLLFVAASVGTGVFTGERSAPMRVFLTASVVNFSLVLAASLILMAPQRDWTWLGAMILGCGVFGLGYSCIAFRDCARDGLLAKIDLEDRTWYIAMPIIGYLALAGSGVMLIERLDPGCAALALSMSLLLGVGIHNAWDITLWSMARRRQDPPPPSPPGKQPPAP